MTLKELRAKHVTLCDAANAIRATAKADGERVLTDDEADQINATMDEADGVQAEVDAGEKRQTAINRLAAATALNTTPPAAPAAYTPPTPALMPSPTIPLPSQAEPNQPKPFGSFGHMLQAVAQAGSHPNMPHDPRLEPGAAISGLGETIGSDGGFLVATDWATEILLSAHNSSVMFNGAPGAAGVQKIPLSTNANGIKINGIDETSRADGSRWGGVQAYWEAEAALKSETKPKFRQIEMNCKKLIGLCYSTDELLQDATALEAVIRRAFAAEFAFKLQDAFTNGTGAGQPLGILNSGCLVSVAKETGQVAKTVVKENLDKMYSRISPSSVPNAAWFINQNVYPQLFSLTQSVGTGGVPVYLPPGGLSASPYGALYGRPVVPIEQCPTLGTVGDVIFADMGQYLFCDKGGMVADSSIHVRFVYDETCFRFVYRCDGQPALASALTPYKDASTTEPVGPFIALATRS